MATQAVTQEDRESIQLLRETYPEYADLPEWTMTAVFEIEKRRVKLLLNRSGTSSDNYSKLDMARIIHEEYLRWQKR